MHGKIGTLLFKSTGKGVKVGKRISEVLSRFKETREKGIKIGAAKMQP